MRTRLILAGGGHAHLFVLERLAREPVASRPHVTLIAPDARHAYSGMVPGLVGGRYRPDEVVLDLAALARSAGAEFVPGAVELIEHEARAVVLGAGRRVPYDLLSLAIGSGIAGSDLPGVRQWSVPVKPIDRTLALIPAVERAAAAAGHDGPRVVVAGAGAAGIELALNLRQRLRRLGRARAPVLVMDGEEVALRDRSAACRRLALKALGRARIDLALGSAVARLDEAAVELDDGRRVAADLVVWATGPVAPSLFRRSGLATDEAGYLRVDDRLRAVGRPEIFAAGDAASLDGAADVPKAGVYAVRQGPVLAANLAAAAAGAPLPRRYRPQRRFLALLNTGDGRAIFSYGPLAVSGRWAMELKDRIDRRFMRRFRR